MISKAVGVLGFFLIILELYIMGRERNDLLISQPTPTLKALYIVLNIHIHP